jgi:hypothetical protein
MILLTHAVVGAAVARLFPHHPWLGFFAAVASHFVLDAIPHWQYRIGSMIKSRKPLDNRIIFGKRLMFDMSIVTLDFLCGLLLSLYFFSGGSPSSARLPLILGAFGGALPDGLQFLYFLIRREPLLTLQKFHDLAGSKRHLDPYSIPGMAAQALLIFATILLSRTILPL